MSSHAYAGKPAVITGAANGIGLALARRAGRLGMRVVLADVEEAALAEATASVVETGADALGVVTDVSSRDSVQALADRTTATFGPPWLVVNNAGVSFGGRTWELRHEDWAWSVGVNLWGVIHGVETFLPGMVERDDGYVLNTASMSGLLVGPGNAPYAAGKHAVVGLSEALHRELRAAGSRVGVSVLCPGLVRTNIGRPRNGTASAPSAAGGTCDGPARLDPTDVAVQAFDAVAERQFWILTHADEYAGRMRCRTEQAATGRNPDNDSVDHVLVALTRIRSARASAGTADDR